jgi:hypothetical protein
LEGPDFICIGMQKAGTAWLYDQLQFHPGFWMPPIKELHYFDKTSPPNSAAAIREQGRADRETVNRQRQADQNRPLGPADDAFFAAFDQMRDQWGDLPAYADLFSMKGGLLSGDITPAYSTLDADRIDAIAKAYPGVRILAILRDPAARALSKLRMEVRKGKAPATLFDSPELLEQRLTSETQRARGFASRFIPLWQAAFADRFAFFFFDDIVDRPQDIRTRILEVLGANPALPSGPLEPGYNRKQSRSTGAIPPSALRAIEAHFADERAQCAALFGGRATEWPGRQQPG